ncbi:MAG TPA: LPS assembly lipoprotein LptE [Paracoccaceae bacterium]|nr:LPS assembly lipoprotein LptE [Paracoccaceae bacterium]HMO70839.1 LPS assembly lipoprotein LptE [Paracoccaceae bacterium]
MSWCERRGLILGLLALPACGFTPAYGPDGGMSALSGRIALPEPRDKATFDLVARLEDRLGRAEAPLFRLETTLRIRPLGLAITPEGAVTRYNLLGGADWRLVEAATGVERLAGRAESFTSYSTTSSTIAGISAQEDAQVRLMRILADQIVTRLMAEAPRLTRLAGP